MKKVKRVYYFDPKDEFFIAMKAEMAHAYKRGYSVIFLRRYLDHSTCRTTYAMLREQGVIPLMPRKRQRKYNIPEQLSKALDKNELGFLQWCNSWGLDPELASQALQGPVNANDPVSVRAHRAVRRDFRNLYCLLYESAQYIPPPREKKPAKRNRDTVTIRFNLESDQYLAFVHEKPDCVAEGDSYEEALARLKYRCAAYSSLVKLQLLPDLDGDGDDELMEEAQLSMNALEC